MTRKSVILNAIAPEGFSYIPNLLTIGEQSDLLSSISELDYQQASFRGNVLKRTTAQFGYTYLLKGKQLSTTAEPMPEFILDVAQKALPHGPSDMEFNQCIVTRYPVGAGIGWHVDAPKFGEHVVGFSLGGAARFQFRPRKSKVVSFEAELSPGSMYRLSGSCRWHLEHRVKEVLMERYSVMFRYVTPSIAT